MNYKYEYTYPDLRACAYFLLNDHKKMIMKMVYTIYIPQKLMWKVWINKVAFLYKKQWITKQSKNDFVE